MIGLENECKFSSNLIIDQMQKHSRILYHGNGYSKEWEQEAKSRGLKDIKSSPEALKAFIEPKAISLFGKYNIYTEKELKSRRTGQVAGEKRQTTEIKKKMTTKFE